MQKPLISVIVCTYNRQDLLPVCLQSLIDQTLDKSLYEVIVINNNSNDETQPVADKIAAGQQNFRVVVETKQGLSHSRNRGLLEATGKYIAYIDDDAKADPNWCHRILNVFQTVQPEPVAVGGKIIPWYETNPPQWFIDDFETRTWGEESGFLKPPRNLYGFSGSNMAFPGTILRKYGGFSPGLGMVGGRLRMGEETELFMKISRQQPLFWYDPEIIVFHWTSKQNMKVSYRFRRSFNSGAFMAYANGRNIFSINYLKNWIGLIRYIMWTPLALVKSGNSKKTELVKRLQEIGARLGYLCGNTSH